MWKKLCMIGIVSLMIIPSLSLANLDVLKVNDSKVYNSIDGNSLSINIEKPKEGCLYITDEETTSTIFGSTVIIDRIIVKVNVESENGISRVKFYVDDAVKNIDCDEAFGKHEIKTVAYDNEGNTDSYSIMVWRFF